MLLAPPVEQRRAPQDLRDVRSGPLREQLRRLVPVLRRAFADADLDQLVRFELLLCLPDHRFADAFVAHLDEGIEMVAQRPPISPLLAGALSHRAAGSSTRA